MTAHRQAPDLKKTEKKRTNVGYLCKNHSCFGCKRSDGKDVFVVTHKEVEKKEKWGVNEVCSKLKGKMKKHFSVVSNDVGSKTKE